MSAYLFQLDSQAPESFQIAPPTPLPEVKSDLIISFNSDMSIASRYGDSVWDFSAVTKKNCRFSFDQSKHTEKIISDLKEICYARLHWSPTSMAISTIRITPVNRLADWAKRNNVTIKRMLNDRRLKKWIASSLASLDYRPAKEVVSLINELTTIRKVNPDFTVAPPDFELHDLLKSVLATIKQSSRASATEEKQTLVIPSRIYAQLIASFESFLAEYLDNAKNIKDFYLHLEDGLKTGGQFETGGSFKRWYKRDDVYPKIVETFNLTALSQKHGFEDKKRFNVYVRDVQEVAKYWIHLFTGMRSEEVARLARGCLSTISARGTNAKILKGYTSKSVGTGASETYWISASIVDLGVNAALSIGEIASEKNNTILDDTKYPLFPTIQAARKGREKSDSLHENASSITNLSSTRIVSLLSRFDDLKVTESDLSEIYASDGFRDATDRVMAGEIWPLASHQFRRSLAVYLARSDLVSLGSLQLQFKHLMSEMTNYYRRNSTFAVNFILNEEGKEDRQSQIEMMAEIEMENRVAQLIDFESNVVEQPQNLWGSEGNRYRRDSERGTPNIILTDKKRRREAFLGGEMTVKESPLGRCTNPEPCNKLSITNVAGPCIGCSRFIGDQTSFEKIDAAIDNLKKTRARYPSESLHYKQTQADIDSLQETRDKAELKFKKGVPA